MLDESVDARTVAAGGVEDRTHRVPLVEAGEQERGALGGGAGDGVGVGHGVALLVGAEDVDDVADGCCGGGDCPGLPGMSGFLDGDHQRR